MIKYIYLRWVTTGHGMLQNQNEPNRNNEIRTKQWQFHKSINKPAKTIKGQTEDSEKSILSDKHNE